MGTFCNNCYNHMVFILIHPFFSPAFNFSKWFWLSVQVAWIASDYFKSLLYSLRENDLKQSDEIQATVQVEGLFCFCYNTAASGFFSRTFIFVFCRNNIFVSNSIFLNIDWSLTGFSKNGLWLLIWFCQGSHMKHNPKLLKESVDKSLEMLQQGKLRGPHISGQFELDQVSWKMFLWVGLQKASVFRLMELVTVISKWKVIVPEQKLRALIS